MKTFDESKIPIMFFYVLFVSKSNRYRFCFILLFSGISNDNSCRKKGRRKVQGVPQSQTAATQNHILPYNLNIYYSIHLKLHIYFDLTLEMQLY